MLIHPKSGITDYIKIEARKFARLGYSTFAINVFEQLGYPAATHIETGSQIQAKTPDPEFTRVLTEAWRFLLSQSHVNPQRVGVLKAGSPVGSGKEDSLSIHYPVRLRRHHDCDSRAGEDVASLQGKWPPSGMALLSVRRSRLRRSGRAGLSRACRGAVVAFGGRFHGTRAAMGLAIVKFSTNGF